MFLLRWFLACTKAFLDDGAVAFSLTDDLVNLSPVRESTDIAVINEIVGFQLAGEVVVVLKTLLWIVFVDSPELHASFFAPIHCLLQEMSFSDTPQDEAVVVSDEHFQCFDGERYLSAYLGIFVSDDGAIKIYCYCCHLSLSFYAVVVLVTIVAVAITAIGTVSTI